MRASLRPLPARRAPIVREWCGIGIKIGKHSRPITKNSLMPVLNVFDPLLGSNACFRSSGFMLDIVPSFA